MVSAGLLSDFFSVLAVAGTAELDFLLSVMYQPDPLKIIPAAEITFLTGSPQTGQDLIGSALKL